MKLTVTDDLVRYKEPLEADELSFLSKKEAKDRSMYYKVFQILMLGSFVVPFAGAWYRAYDGAPNAFSPLKYFATAFVLLSISSLSTYLTYRFNLRRVQLDIAEKTKTIEISHIIRKMHMPARNAYYFFLDSRIKLSIEVSYDHYVSMAIGDEVCIEYTSHSRQYLGYF